MKQGAFDYLTKPIHPEELLLVANQAASANFQQFLRRRLPFFYGIVLAAGIGPEDALHKFQHRLSRSRLFVGPASLPQRSRQAGA